MLSHSNICFTGILLLSFFAFVACRDKCYGLKYDYEELVKYNQAEFEMYDFRPGERVASIGASSGWFEVANSVFTDSMVFYIQDIDPDCANQKKINRLKRFYLRHRAGPMTNQLIAWVGSSESTGLPQASFDKVLLRLSFHEFSQPEPMLSEIYHLLKPEGRLFVAENIVEETGQTDENCDHALWSWPDLVEEIEKNGFILLHISNPEQPEVIEYEIGDTYRIFCFIKSPAKE
ncbi:MAG: hypothetical protein OHK0053_27570 [Microscillaceae bacterium]